MSRLSAPPCGPWLGAILLLLPACAAGGPNGSDTLGAAPSAGVSGAGQGAAVGAGVGAGIGCLSAVLSGEGFGDCLKRAAIGATIGGVAGAAGGYIIADKSGRYAVDEQRLAQRLEEVDAELAQSRKAVAAAQQTVARHERQLAETADEVRRGRARQAELDRVIAEAKSDGQRIATARDQAAQDVAALNGEVKALRARQLTVPAELEQKRTALLAERDRLDQQLEILSGAVVEAERTG